VTILYSNEGREAIQPRCERTPLNRYKPTVAVYGGANVDIQARCAERYRPADSNPGTASMSLGGVGRNIADNLARLGLATELVTVFGGDENAAILADGCRARGIEVGRSLILPDEATSRYVCILDADGSLVGAVAAMRAIDRFGPAELAARFEPGDDADVIVIDANLPPDTIALAADRWRDKPMLLDTVSAIKARRASTVVGRFSMLKPNVPEAYALLGLEQEHGADRAAGAVAMLGRHFLDRGVREAFISLGARGLSWLDKDGSGIAVPLSMPVINVSGAGDAAAAALVWATVNRATARDKACLAVAAASLCASSAEVVSEAMSAQRLQELARGVSIEPLS